MKKNVLSRREFLKECGLLAGATAVATSFPWMTALSEENQKATDGEKLRVAVIGPGSRGRYHLNFLVRNPKVEVTWLCDVYQPSLDKALAIAPGAKTCKDYREVLDDPEVDAIYVVTPLDTHKQITVDAFEAGKHVFCEKSLSHNCADALEMYNAHLRTGKVFFVGQQRLYDPYYLEAIRMIEEGMFGPIEGIKTFWYRNADWRREVPSPELERLINWRLYREHSCGLMTELACHQVQLGTWIYKDIPETIMGSGAITFWKDGREVEDNVNVIYTYKDGRRVSFESIISNKFYGLEEQIMGHLGTVEPEKGKYGLPAHDQRPGEGYLRRSFVRRAELGPRDRAAEPRRVHSGPQASAPQRRFGLPERRLRGSLPPRKAAAHGGRRGLLRHDHVAAGPAGHRRKADHRLPRRV